MRKIILALTIFTSGNAIAQVDTAMSTITITVPVKAVVLYANYFSESPTWADRKAPDYFITKIGSGTLPDSLVIVTITANQLAGFAIRLTAERYGAIGATARSIFNNNPSIPGYTALFTQVTTKANGATSEKNAAIFVLNKYNAYSQTMTDLYNQMYTNGLNWIRN